MAWELAVGLTLVASGVVLFVLLPILRGDWATLESPDDEITEVDARKQAALRGLRDAEYDFRTGKLDQADYQILKSDLARQALEAIEEESATSPAPDKGTLADAPGKSAESAARDANRDKLETEIARVRKGIAQGRTCPACGHLNVKKSRFCTGCGGALGEAVAVAGEPASG